MSRPAVLEVIPAPPAGLFLGEIATWASGRVAPTADALAVPAGMPSAGGVWACGAGVPPAGDTKPGGTPAPQAVAQPDARPGCDEPFRALP